MNLDKIKGFFSSLSNIDLPTGGAALAGVVLLFLVLKTGKIFSKVLLILIAIGLLVGAWWWHTHK